MRKTALLVAVASACAAPPAPGQVVIGGGVGYGIYGPPYPIVDPWLLAPAAPRIPGVSPSCYRYGRCSPAELSAYQYRAERLDRLAPVAPPGDTVPLEASRPPPPPTAAQEIRPEYQGASVVREEYRDSGRPVDGRQ
jgi:hypothetical protein